MSWIRFAGPVQWSLFVVVFFAIAIWESLQPKRQLSFPAERRWGRHAMLFAIAGVFSTVLIRASPIAVAVAVTGSRFGILNKSWLPFLPRCLAAVVLLDLVHYATHRAFHSVSVLWRVHEVHHSDPDYDVSTAARFHPIEVVLTQGAYLAVVAVLAPPAVGVFAAVLLTVALNLFAHANASLPGWVEKPVRALFVTPDMHRIHHSEDIAEQSRNFGQTFPWWDRIFGTYLAKPAAGEGMVTGIAGLQEGESVGLGFMLAEPFRPPTHSQADPAS
jgi:sterol desaturase/sphingolipid hydroxylase (fatty acid hydroxylase superfamily)